MGKLAPQKQHEKNRAIEIVRGELAKQLPKLIQLVPQEADVKKTFRALVRLLEQDEGWLTRCSPKSLVLACADAVIAELNLGTGMEAEAYIVPFAGEAVMIPGYRGLREIAARNGWKLIMESVHVGDTYQFLNRWTVPVHTYGPEKLNGQPGRRDRPVRACFVIARRQGEIVVHQLSYDEILAHRDRYSKSWKRVKDDPAKRDDHPWNDAHPAVFRVMGMKTVLRDMFGRRDLPLSSDKLQEIASRDEDFGSRYVEGSSTASPSQQRQLAHDIDMAGIDDFIDQATNESDGTTTRESTIAGDSNNRDESTKIRDSAMSDESTNVTDSNKRDESTNEDDSNIDGELDDNLKAKWLHGFADVTSIRGVNGLHKSLAQEFPQHAEEISKLASMRREEIKKQKQAKEEAHPE